MNLYLCVVNRLSFSMVVFKINLQNDLEVCCTCKLNTRILINKVDISIFFSCYSEQRD